MKSDALLIIADSERDADMRYATGIQVPDPFIYLNVRGRSLAVLSDLEFDRARRQAQVDRVLPLSTYRRKCERDGIKTPGLTDVAVKLCRELRVKKVLVPFSFSAGLLRQLRKLGLKVKVRDGWFFPDREFKNAAEVKMISAALGMAEVGMAEGIHALKRAKIGKNRQLVLNGAALTSERLRAIIESAILHAGGLPGNTIVAGGEQACDPHERGHGPLAADKPIILDIFPRSARTGYWGDITRTVVRGRASEKVHRQYDTVRRGQELAFSLLTDGVEGAKVHQAVEKLFKSAGYRTRRQDGRHVGFFHGTGHGLGLDIHEPPRTGRKSADTLRAGHVVTIEPGLYYPETGGVRLEDVALVTTNGPVNLTRFEKVLEV
jgi:Xaa-Pro aminopeptidase